MVFCTRVQWGHNCTMVTWDLVAQSLSNFLCDWRPSSTEAPHVEWLCVSKLRGSKVESNGRHGLMTAWEALCNSKMNDVDCMDVQRLAREHHVMFGKWMMFLSSKVVDDAWNIIANAVVAGDLRNYAKVSTLHYRGLNKSDTKGKAADFEDGASVMDSHVMCIYTDNFDDMEVVFELAEKIQKLGFKEKLMFKPDAYTFCGIYSGNHWGIAPTIYNS